MSRRVGWIVAIAAASIVPLSGVMIASQVTSPRQAASNAAPPVPSPITASVERRRLEDIVRFRGDVVAPDSVVVEVPRLPDGVEPVVTSAPFNVGDGVGEGDVLVSVSGRPVIGLAGLIHMFRDIGPGARGIDVEQLQAALERLGLHVRGDRTGEYGRASQAAVVALYRQRGFEVRYSDIDPLASVPIVPLGEVAFLPTLPAVVTVSNVQLGQMPGSQSPVVGSGEQSGNGTEGLLTMAAGAPVVQGVVGAADAGLISPGTVATITSEDGSELPATVRSVGTESVPTPSGGTGRAVVLVPDDVLGADAIGANLLVSITSASTPAPVLVVPLAAVSSTAAEQTLVSVLAEPNSSARDVPVSVGATAEGFVEVAPIKAGDLREGDLVIVGISAGNPAGDGP